MGEAKTEPDVSPITGSPLCGAALEARLAGPNGVSLDSNDNVYHGKKGDGPEGDDTLDCPHGVFVDKGGLIFIDDSETNRVQLWRR